VKAKLNALVISVLDEGERLASRSGHLLAGTLWKGGWVIPGNCLEVDAKIKICLKDLH